MAGQGPYNVQCVSGDPTHVMEVIPDTQLELMCRKRESRGLLDAVTLDTSECPSCVDETREREGAALSMLGCPIAGLDGCDDDCPCKWEIPDSPYADQVRGLPITAA